MNLHKILVPIDCSDDSDEAVAFAKSYALEQGASITLLYVVESDANVIPMGPERPDGERAEKVEAQIKMDTIAADLASREMEVYTALAEGRPEKAIVDYAKSHEIGLIVLCKHSFPWLQRHVAHGVEKNAPCLVKLVEEKHGKSEVI